ncbi:MAG: hypothetical protein VYA18_16625, partial [Pseudomonadota bacterium]|nr:hypothetical protein [Pseudomonadota bacterium]
EIEIDKGVEFDHALRSEANREGRGTAVSWFRLAHQNSRKSDRAHTVNFKGVSPSGNRPHAPRTSDLQFGLSGQ